MARVLVLCTRGDTVICNVWKSQSRRRCFCDATICGGGEGRYVNLGLPQGPASAVPRGRYVDSAGLIKE